MTMTYDPEAVERRYDLAGMAEYERHDRSPEMRMKLELHLTCLRSFVHSGSRVLEIGPGPGRFTEVLAAMGCRVLVVDISSEQLRLNRERAEEQGYAGCIEEWLKADICDLSALRGQRFDSIVAFGGPFSYVFEWRDRAMEECLSVLKPRGRLLLSVMSRWGSLHAFLQHVPPLPRDEIDTIIRTGDIAPSTTPQAAADGHHHHWFTADELRGFLEAHTLSVEFMAASNALSTRWGELLEDEAAFAVVLELERQATQSPGALDMGTHILAVAARSGRADA
jgi:ubiquinone/menaquinone biosynthesis C-methylase UbiE